jgi:hypothetical protein
MKVLFPVLVLCTAAVVAVVLAIHFRVKRHLRDQSPPSPAAEASAERERSEAGNMEDVKQNHPS